MGRMWLALILTVAGGPAWPVEAQTVSADESVPAALAYRSYSASRTKCGFDAFVSTTPPVKYLHQTISEQAFAFTYPEAALPFSDIYYYWFTAAACAGSFTFVNNVSWTPGASASATYYKLEPGWPYPLTLGIASWSGDTSGMGGDTSPAYPIPKQHSPVMSAGGPSIQGQLSVIFTPDPLGMRTESYGVDSCVVTASGDVVLTVGPTNSVSETTLVLATDGGWTPATQTHQLSNPYTTTQLKALVEADLFRCEPGWGQDVSFVLGGNPSCVTNTASTFASSTLFSDELTYSRRQIKYRFSFPTEEKRNYLASWEERTTFSNGTEPVYLRQEQIYKGNGGIVTSAEFTVTPRHAPAGVTAMTRVVNLKVETTPCAPCQGCTVVRNGSAQLDFDLGRTAFGEWAGKLWVKERKPGLILARPDSLQFTGDRGEVDVVTNGACIVQARAAEMLASVVTNGPFSYAVEFFAAMNVGPKVGGFYQTQGSPYRTWTIENPDASTNSFHRLRAVEAQSGKSITNEFVWTEATQTWELSLGNGLRKESKRTDWANNHTERTETMETRAADGALVYKERQRYQQFDWGDGLMEEIVDPDGAALSTTYEYDAEGSLTMVRRSDGSWERYGWGPYSGRLKRLVERRTPFLNAPPTAPDYELRVTSYCYAPLCSLDPSDDGTVEPFTPRYMAVRPPHTRTYHLLLPGEKREYRYTGGGDYWANPENLLTLTRTFTNGPFQGEIQSIVNPDGTLERYEYSTNAAGTLRTNVVTAGAPSAGGAITNGARTITLLNQAGQVLSRIVADIPSGLVTDSETVTLDEQGRPVRVAYFDGTFTATVYDCCGVSAVTNREGSVVTYEYDDLKRRVAERSHLAGGGILSLLYSYNAAGDITSIVRVGTDGSQIPVKRCGYDLARRLVAETNAPGLVTTHAYLVEANGQSTTTTTYAAGTSQSVTRLEARHRDGSLARVTGTAVHPVRYEHTAADLNFNTSEIRLDSQGNDTSERHFTLVNGVGNILGETAFHDGSPAMSTSYHYNNKNQLWKRFANGATVTFFTNDTRGRLEYTVLDFNRDDLIDFAGADRITRTVSDVTTSYGTTVLRTRTYIWPGNNVDAARLIRTVESSADGQRTWTTAFGQTSSVQMVYAGNGNRFTTNTAPDGTLSVQHYQDGRLMSSQTLNPQLGGNPQGSLNSTTYGYDAHGRQTSVTDARNGTTFFTYDTLDRPISVTTPAPGPGLNPQTTVSHYDELGRSLKIDLPDGGSVTNEYYQTGELKKTHGTRTYPVEYIYDHSGRLRTNVTWQNFASQTGAAQTTWNYDASSGLLTAKRYADPATGEAGGTGPDYTYNNRGQLVQRTWVRGIAVYDYNNAGELASIAYTGEPSVFYTYDRLGRLASVTRSGAATTYAYTDAGQPLSETYSGGPLDGLTVTNAYDALQRRTALTLNSQPSTINLFNYDPASRLASVSDGPHSAGYTYLANSVLLENTFFTNGPTRAMTTTRQYDLLNRLLSVSSLNSQPGGSPQGPLNFFSYQHNSANQRTRADLGGTSYTSPTYSLYGYDPLGQLIAGKKYWPDNAPVAGQQFEYTFDDIGNRTATKAGGDENGANLRTANYTANLLNQYTSRTVPGFLTILGEAAASATVTVNNQPTLRHGEYFRAELLVDNGPGPVLQTVTNVGVLNQGNDPDLVASSTGQIFVAQTPEQFHHDADGNLTNDGRWQLRWDAENRLVELESRPDVPPALRQKLVFAYDHQGRRVSKTVSNWNLSTLNYELSTQTKFAYDLSAGQAGGWNLIAELDATNGLLRSYTWGTDLSGTLQGAGGVGGLLSITDHTLNPQPTTCFYTYDGNGNVIALVNAADGSIAAQYEYGPFGELLRATGPLALVNPFRFSTKYQDDETGFLYYGHRYYNASTGRWLSRDPIEEGGGLNHFAFAYNNGVNAIDDVGLGVIYVVRADGSKSVTFTPPAKPAGLLPRLWSGDGNAKAKKRECKSKCDDLKALLMKAYLAGDVYANRNGGAVPESPNFERLSSDQLIALGIDPKQMINDKSGFYAALYLDHISGNYTVAFRGTQEGKDWLSNLGQGAGLPDAQYKAAARLGARLGVKFPGKISGVGHSLGGGLDTVAALSGRFPGVNFNPAGVSAGTAARLGIPLSSVSVNSFSINPAKLVNLNIPLSGADKLITSYSVPGDILSRGLNQTYLAPKTDGRQVVLPSPGSLPLGINRHLMSSVIASIQRELAQHGCK